MKKVRQVVFGRGEYQYETILHYPHRRLGFGENKPNQMRILISGPWNESTGMPNSPTKVQYRAAIVDLRTADPFISGGTSVQARDKDSSAEIRGVREMINELKTAGMITTSQ